MVEIPAFTLLSLDDLGIARELVSQPDKSIVTFETPGVILKSPKVEAVKCVRAILAGEERVIEFGFTIFLAEEKSKTVLGITSASTIAATNAQAGVDLEPFGPIGIKEFQGSRSFPCQAVSSRV